MTSRRLQKWILAALTVCLLSPLGAWELPPLFGGDQLQQALAARIESALHRKCRLGPVSLEGSRLLTEQLVLSNEPDFSKGTFLTANGVVLTIDLQSLLPGLDGTALAPDTSKGRLSAGFVTLAAYKAQDVMLDWDLAGLRGGVNTTSGTVSVAHSSGTLNLRGAASAKNAELATQLGLPDLSRIPTGQLTANGRIEKGLFRLAELKAAGPAGTIVGSGTMALESEALSGTAKVHRPGTKARGELDAELELTGSRERPVVRIKSLKQKRFNAVLKNL